MSFQEYLKKEKSVLKYQELLEKFHGGKTLHERTSLENGLVQACQGTLVKKLAGREFCFSMTNELECPYQKEDSDNLYSCTRTYIGGYSHYESIYLNKEKNKIIKEITLIH